MTTPLRISAETLELAAAELARIGDALLAGERDGCGVLVFRDASGRVVAAGISEDVEAGMIADVQLTTPAGRLAS